MIETVPELERSLGQLLGTVAGQNKVNRLDSQTVRSMTIEFRRDIDSDNADHGAPIDSPDWNLIMDDAFT